MIHLNQKILCVLNLKVDKDIIIKCPTDTPYAYNNGDYNKCCNFQKKRLRRAKGTGTKMTLFMGKKNRGYFFKGFGKTNKKHCHQPTI